MKIPNIRFNLKFYDERGEAITIRTVEDLKNNFNVSDAYAYMMDGTLSRWLRSLREVECAECVERARSESAVRVQVEALLTAFDLEADNADMEAFLSSLTHETSAMQEQRDDSDCPVDSYNDNGDGGRSPADEKDVRFNPTEIWKQTYAEMRKYKYEYL